MIVLRYKKFSDSKKGDNKKAPLFLIPGLAAGTGTGLLIGKTSIKPDEKAINEAKDIIGLEINKLHKDNNSVEKELKKLSKSKLGRKLTGQSEKYNKLLKKREEIAKAYKNIPKMIEDTANGLAKKHRKAYTKKSMIIGGISGLAASGVGYGIYKHAKNKKNDSPEE